MAFLRLALSILLCLTLNGCLPKDTRIQNFLPRQGDNLLRIYLQPTLQGADHVRFSLEGISAVKEDGRQIALALSVRELDGARLKGQQKLADGFLPQGAYSGILLKFDKAFLRSEEGETALYVAEAPLDVRQAFTIRQNEAKALFLTFAPGNEAGETVRFIPRFSLSAAGAIASNLTGYASLPHSSTLAVFNKKSMQVVDVLSTGREPRGMALDQIRGQIYVALSGEDAVAVIDALKGRMIEVVKLNFQDRPTDLDLTPDGRLLVCVNSGSNTISIIDALSQFEIKRIPVDAGPISVVVEPSGLKAFVMSSLSNTITVIDLSQRQIAATIAVEGSPLRGAFNRSGDRLFVICPDSLNLSIIDPSALSVVGKIIIGIGACAVRVDPRTGVILVGSCYSDEIAFIDPFSKMRIDTIATKGKVADLVIDNEENSLFLALTDRSIAQKANLTSKRVSATVELGEPAYAMVVMGER